MSKAREDLSLDRALAIPSLISAFAAGLDPTALIRDLHGRIRDDRTQAVWIDVVPLEMASGTTSISPSAGALPAKACRSMASPSLSRTISMSRECRQPRDARPLLIRQSVRPGSSSSSWRRGAILLGKTNLDQFAAGLTGARSPYGTPSAAVFDPRLYRGSARVPGSAVAVRRGLVESFSARNRYRRLGACARPPLTISLQV